MRLPERTINIREAYLHEDTLIAKHFYQLWRDNDVPEHSIRSNWLEVTVQFINHARQELHYKAFIAEVSGTVVGSAGCQLFNGRNLANEANRISHFHFFQGLPD